MSSACSNRHSALLDNIITKESQSNSLCAEDYFTWVPITKAIETEAEVSEIDNKANIDNDIDQEEEEDVMFLIDASD